MNNSTSLNLPFRDGQQVLVQAEFICAYRSGDVAVRFSPLALAPRLAPRDPVLVPGGSLRAAEQPESAGATLDELRSLHTPYGIFDQCDHEHEPGDPGVVNADEIGLTCAKLYDICRLCCCNKNGQTLECVESHEHGVGVPICKTAEILSRVAQSNGSGSDQSVRRYRLVARLLDRAQISEGDAMNLLGVDRLTCREILLQYRDSEQRTTQERPKLLLDAEIEELLKDVPGEHSGDEEAMTAARWAAKWVRDYYEQNAADILAAVVVALKEHRDEREAQS